MGVTTVTVYTCDRCGATVTGAPPLGSGQLTLDYFNAEADVSVTLCPSCVEQLLVWFATPPQ